MISEFFSSCLECPLDENCPCGWSLNCAACIMLQEKFNEQVYCTNCKHFHMDDNQIVSCKYEFSCDCWDFEDSKRLLDRPHYEPKITKEETFKFMRNNHMTCSNCKFSKSVCDDEDGYSCSCEYHNPMYLEFSGDYCSHWEEKIVNNDME